MGALDVDKDEMLAMTAMHAATVVAAIQSCGNGGPDQLRRAAEVVKYHAERLWLIAPLLAADMRTAADAQEKAMREAEVAKAVHEGQGVPRQ